MVDPAAFVPDLVRWESAVPWMYRDTLGYVTCAIGSLIHDADNACTYPFMTEGRPSSHGEIQREFLRVVAMTKGRPAGTYRKPDAPRVELTDDGVRDVTVSRLRHDFIPGLLRMFIGFDAFPSPAQRALVDMAWNLGTSGLLQFSHLRAAVERRDWLAASQSCHVKTSREDRNEWRAELLRGAG